MEKKKNNRRSVVEDEQKRWKINSGRSKMKKTKKERGRLERKKNRGTVADGEDWIGEKALTCGRHGLQKFAWFWPFYTYCSKWQHIEQRQALNLEWLNCTGLDGQSFDWGFNSGSTGFWKSIFFARTKPISPSAHCRTDLKNIGIKQQLFL